MKCFKWIAVCAMVLGLGVVGFSQATVKINPKMKEADIMKKFHSMKNGTIFKLAAGTYTLTGPIDFTGKKGIKIVGAGQGKTKIVTKNLGDDVFSFSECKDVTIEKLSAKHKEKPEGGYCVGSVIYFLKCENVNVIDCELNGCGMTGVYFDNTISGIVEKCFIHNNSVAALFSYGSSYLQILNNTIKDNYNGFYIESNPYLEDVNIESMNIKMEGNVWENNKEWKK